MDSESIFQKNSHMTHHIKNQESFSLSDSFPPKIKKYLKLQIIIIVQEIKI